VQHKYGTRNPRSTLPPPLAELDKVGAERIGIQDDLKNAKN
jgi:hypothetical protein